MVIAFPMCWKCCHIVEELIVPSVGQKVEYKAYRMVGCTADKRIRSFADAKEMCHLLGRKVDESKIAGLGIRRPSGNGNGDVSEPMFSEATAGSCKSCVGR